MWDQGAGNKDDANINSNNKPVITAAVLTKPSSKPMSNLRSRMPVILKRDNLTQWIKGSYMDAQSLIQNADASDIALTPVPKKPAAQGSLL